MKKIKITCGHGEYQGGVEYVVPDEEADKLVEQQQAVLVEEKPPKVEKKVKHDNW